MDITWRLDGFRAFGQATGLRKRLPGTVYLHREAGVCHREPFVSLLQTLSARHGLGNDFNVVKFRTDAPRLSFLSYPDFYDEPHPSLARSFAIDLSTGKCYDIDYSDNLNPPILHRKELLLEPGHPRISEYIALSAAEEAAGLYRNSAVIGFRENWKRTLAELGIEIEGHSLKHGPKRPNNHPPVQPITVHRHKTAITRYDLSKPIKTLLEHDQLKSGDTLFDYGCGLGADVRGLREMGYETRGWDPVHAPHETKSEADIVNLGYVLNVIEDPAERLETLTDAWRLARKLLIVSTLIGSPLNAAETVAFQDGILTRRNTFQKYFSQKELQQYLEDALNNSAVPAALGVFYVFRDPADHQGFLQSRSRRSVDWSALTLRFEKPEKPPKVQRQPRLSRYEEHRELLEEFWSCVLQFGRLPEPSEFARYPELEERLGSAPKAMRLLLAQGRTEMFAQAQASRKNDLLVYLALANLRKKILFTQLPESVRQDIRTLFGSYDKGLAEGLKILHSSADPNTIALACDDASVGWQDEKSLYVHSSLVGRLPTVLRAYVACAELLYGDLTGADIIKIHKLSGKVTFLVYTGFESAALPELESRTKVNLRTGSVEVFGHREQGQMLCFKERFLALEHPERDKLVAVSQRLREMGVSDSDFHVPSNSEIYAQRICLEDITLRATGETTCPIAAACVLTFRLQRPAQHIQRKRRILRPHRPPPIPQLPLHQAPRNIRHCGRRQLRIHRADLPPCRRSRKHLRQLTLALLHQMDKLDGKRLSLHAHAAEFRHVDPQEVLMRLEIPEPDLQVSRQLVPPGRRGAHRGARVSHQGPRLLQ